MNAVFAFYRSTVGKKVIMAVTGLLMILFVIAHMVGNLKAFGGFDSAGVAKLDHYAEFLKTFGSDVFGREGFLWLARFGLLGTVALHFLTAFQLIQRNRTARPENYTAQRFSSASVASLSMGIGGIFLLVFIVVHVLHFTSGHLHFSGFEHGRVYANIYSSFQKPLWVLFYAVAMTALCLHLYHGSWSIFQSLGIDKPGWNKTFRLVARGIAVVVAVGFIAVPISIFFKVLPPPPPIVAASTHHGEGH